MPTATKKPAKAAPARAPRKIAPAITRSGDTRGQIQVRLPSALIQRLEEEADRRRVSKTFLVEQMILNALPRWEEQDLATI
jgi:hypothetical protein